MRTAHHRNLLRTLLVALIVADLIAGVSLVANQLLGLPDLWAWALGALLSIPTFRVVQRWADGVVDGHVPTTSELFSGEKIP